MAKRPHIKAEIKIASLLLEVWSLRGHGMPFAEAQRLSARDICRMVEWDHATPHAIGGSIHPTNLTAMLKGQHRAKTRRDVAQIAKGKRIQRAQAVHAAALRKAGLVAVDVTGAKADIPAPRKRAWPSRSWPKQQGKRK